jgi:bifunctional hydroxylase/dehydrase
METEVVVAGAGPTGLMLAGELRLAGVSVVVLERLPAPTGESRSLGLNPRAVEFWDQRGILDRFTGARFVPRGHYGALPASLDFSDYDTPHGVMLVHQARTEQFLSEWVQELGVEIRRGHEVVGLRQTPTEVEIGVRGPDGEYRIPASYLVGCDGAHSSVRKLSGIAFPGEPSTVDVLMADVADLDLEFQMFKRSQHGLWAVFPAGEGVFRVVVYDFGRPPARAAERPTFDEVCEAAARVGGLDLTRGTARWLARHGNTTRQAGRYRVGRVLLAGDAAHVQPPAGGQALTSGLSDVVNLGWKLAAQVNGWAPDGLLDSYCDERYPIGERVMMHARAQNLLMSGGPGVQALRSVFTELMQFPDVNRYLGGAMSCLGDRYDLAGEGDHQLLGRRIPCRSLRTADGWSAGRGHSTVWRATTTFRLLHRARGVFLDLADEPALCAIASRWADRVDAITANCTDGGLDDLAAVLVRPDGHVAWLAAKDSELDKDGLKAALRRWFGNPLDDPDF